MKVLITGGTVFVSRYCAEYFVRQGHEVYVLNRNTRPQSSGVKLIECDRHCIGDRLKNHYFDVVMDITGYNERDVSDLVSALGEYGRYFFISSSAVYPETAPQPFRESQPCGVNIHWGDYGTNKIAAERFLLDNVEKLYIIRPPYLYGKMNNLYREAFVFECAENDLPFYVPGGGEMPLQFFDVNDLCRFIDVLLKKQPDQRVFNVGNPNTLTVSEWVRACYAVLGKEPELRSVADHDPQRWFCFRDYAYSLDVSSQQTLMPDLKLLSDGLRESYEWYAAHRGEVRRKDYLSYIIDNIEEM